MATVASRQEKNLVQQKQPTINLTPTGLLMEGHFTCYYLVNGNVLRCADRPFSKSLGRGLSSQCPATQGSFREWRLLPLAIRALRLPIILSAVRYKSAARHLGSKTFTLFTRVVTTQQVLQLTCSFLPIFWPFEFHFAPVKTLQSTA